MLMLLLPPMNAMIWETHNKLTQSKVLLPLVQLFSVGPSLLLDSQESMPRNSRLTMKRCKANFGVITTMTKKEKNGDLKISPMMDPH